MNIIEATKKALAENKCEELAEQIADGQINPNEARQEMGLEPIKDGDGLLVSKTNSNLKCWTCKATIEKKHKYCWNCGSKN